MGLKCSLFGHSFDETDVEREREERGSEVVTVVKEVERCSRCGETRVVSENKEVTSIVDPDEVDLDEGESSSTALGELAAGADDTAPTGGGFESGSDLEEFESPENPDEEDAEILEDNRPSDRRPGQWPDDETDWDPGQLTRPTAEPEADETADVDAAPETDDEAEPAAEADPADADGGEFIDAEADPANAAASSETSDASTESLGGISVPDGEYACPECGFTTRAENSPLRAGDACPECQRGYLEAGE
ncbi:DUF7093 family protein [Halorarius litoreus]|uniref:DUF7093 family protein n=1 Tax=Halorarius litoreus TaxID=2962676 RepID=UPI0020CEB025|nr:hypothetical protein [Halorarius litoreus]